MNLNQNIKNNFQVIIDRNKKTIPSDNNETLNYLYPNGHRITHQMRWFKASRLRRLQSDISA